MVAVEVKELVFLGGDGAVGQQGKDEAPLGAEIEVIISEEGVEKL